MTTPPLVLLDLDGTLSDSAPGIVGSARHAYRTLGLPVPADDVLLGFVGPPLVDAFTAHGVPAGLVPAAVTAYRDVYAAGGMYETRVFDGIPEALGALRDAGARLVVATSKPERFAVPVCERFGITELVDLVVGAPPDEVPSSKATVVADALRRLGPDRVPPRERCVMVGDREHDVVGAAAHGIACVGVAWGYAAPGELERAGAVDVVASPDELVAVVLDRVLPSAA